MKKLTCEMCNSVDLIKKDGLYVCQYCGTKYTVEEAKKMMTKNAQSTTMLIIITSMFSTMDAFFFLLIASINPITS